MNRILLTGIAVLGLGTAVVPADAAHKQVRQYDQAPAQAQWSGVRVEEVLANTPAANAGIRPGDVIVGMGGRAVNGYADVDAAVAASGGRPLTIDIVRGGARARLRAAPRHHAGCLWQRAATLRARTLPHGIQAEVLRGRTRLRVTPDLR